MIKKLFKKAIKLDTETKKDIAANKSEHIKVRESILQNHKDTSERIKNIRSEWGFTQYK